MSGRFAVRKLVRKVTPSDVKSQARYLMRHAREYLDVENRSEIGMTMPWRNRIMRYLI